MASLTDLFNYRPVIDGDPKTPVEQASRAQFYAAEAIRAGRKAHVEKRVRAGSNEWAVDQQFTASAKSMAEKKGPVEKKASARYTTAVGIRKQLAELARVASALSRGEGDLGGTEVEILHAALSPVVSYRRPGAATSTEKK